MPLARVYAMDADAPDDHGGGDGWHGCGTAGGTMISPEEIPRIDGDMASLAAHADSVAATATAFADTGARVHQTWQGLGGVYRAPESGQLLASTGPVMSVSASVGEDLGIAATALRTYATDTAAVQARLDVLRLQAADLVAAAGSVQDESTAVALDERSAGLSAAVAAEVEAWEAAQRRCASTLRELTGSAPTTLVEPGLPTTTAYPGTLQGPLQEVYPVDPLTPTNTGHPPLVLGPGVLVNVPPPPGTGIVDGPASYPSPLGPGGLLIDAATADPGATGGPGPQPDVVPDFPVREPVGNAQLFPPEDFEETEYSVDELAALAYRHSGAGDTHIGGSEERPTETEALDALEQGKRTPLEDQNAVRYDHNGVRVIINRDLPWKSTTYYPER